MLPDRRVALSRPKCGATSSPIPASRRSPGLPRPTSLGSTSIPRPASCRRAPASKSKRLSTPTPTSCRRASPPAPSSSRTGPPAEPANAPRCWTPAAASATPSIPARSTGARVATPRGSSRRTRQPTASMPRKAARWPRTSSPGWKPPSTVRYRSRSTGARLPSPIRITCVSGPTARRKACCPAKPVGRAAPTKCLPGGISFAGPSRTTPRPRPAPMPLGSTPCRSTTFPPCPWTSGPTSARPAVPSTPAPAPTC